MIHDLENTGSADIVFTTVEFLAARTSRCRSARAGRSVKSAPFAYHAPETIDEAVALLEPGGERARARRRPEPRAADEVPRA